MKCRENLIGGCADHGDLDLGEDGLCRVDLDLGEDGLCRVGRELQAKLERPLLTFEGAAAVMQYLYGSQSIVRVADEGGISVQVSSSGARFTGKTFNEAIDRCRASSDGRPILQDWVCRLGLRHQGVLVSAVRGCDTAPKENGSKALTRYLRAAVLNAHCGDPRKAKSFIEVPTAESFKAAEDKFFHEWDALPLHYVMHLAHAAEIIGYHSGVENRQVAWVTWNGDAYQNVWLGFYMRVCMKLHLNPETKEQLDERLNKNEDGFGKEQEK
jgi:hypothetical protein